MPKKFVSCVKKVKKQSSTYNPYAVCRVSTGFYGSTHHISKSKVKNCKIVDKILGKKV